MVGRPKPKEKIWLFYVGYGVVLLILSLWSPVNLAQGIVSSTTWFNDLQFLAVGLAWVTLRPSGLKSSVGQEGMRVELILMILFLICFTSAMFVYVYECVVSTAPSLFWYLGIATWTLNVLVRIKEFRTVRMNLHNLSYEIDKRVSF